MAARTSTDAWAVGSFTKANNLVQTLIERWDGSSWTRVKSPNAGQPAGGQLSSVVALAADDAWAVGSFGQGAPSRTLIEHWDGTAWTVVPSPNKGPFPNALSDVDAVAPDDIWAVGTWFTKAFDDRTLTLHWNGATWSRVASPNAGPASAANDLVSVAAVATDDVWAVGLRGLKTLAMHWDGTAWAVVASPTPEGIADLAAVVAVATDDVWAVGGFVDHTANAVRTLVEHWDGTAWSVVASANKGPSDNHLWGISAATGRLLAVGDRLHRRRHRPARPARAGALRRLARRPVRVGAGSYNRPVPPFRIASDFQPAGDQPEAIDSCPRRVEAGEERLTLLGATGHREDVHVAHVVERVQRPRW